MMPGRRHGNDPRLVGLADSGSEATNQCCMAHVICRELQFETDRVPFERTGHDAGVGNEPIDRPVERQDGVGKCINALELCKIEREGQNRTLGKSVRQHLCGFIQLAGGSGTDKDIGAGGQQGADSLVSEAAAAAGDHCKLARQIDATHDLVAGGFGAARHGF